MLLPVALLAAPWTLSMDQVTFGPNHHFFGYIGHVKNIPWNGTGRYIVSLETTFQDRMPKPKDAANVVLIDTQNGNRVQVVEETHGWNFQQGTMFYWNPAAPDTELFFNDRDPATGHVFTVLFDIAKRRRIREYRYTDTPIGNSGVAQGGGQFAGINYARLARLRPVTGYPDSYDWAASEPAPTNDGVFLVDVLTGRKRLLISFSQMVERLRAQRPEIVGKHLFINHTLWNRDGTRLWFYIRANFDTPQRVNIPCTIRPDGADLQVEQFIGGHPEWENGPRIIGDVDKRQVIYDVDRDKVVATLGDREIFPDPGGDIALSPDGTWLVNASRQGHSNFYTVFHRKDGSWRRSEGLAHPGYTSGELRVDGSPNWNRTGRELLFPAIAKDGTRQLFRIRIVTNPAGKP